MDKTLSDLLEYEEILGAIAYSSEGLVLSSAGLTRSDAEVFGAVGASLLGAVDSTSRRLGAGPITAVSFGAREGMVHCWAMNDLALAIFTEPRSPTALEILGQRVLNEISLVVDPMT